MERSVGAVSLALSLSPSLALGSADASIDPVHNRYTDHRYT